MLEDGRLRFDEAGRFLLNSALLVMLAAGLLKMVNHEVKGVFEGADEEVLVEADAAGAAAVPDAPAAAARQAEPRRPRRRARRAKNNSCRSEANVAPRESVEVGGALRSCCKSSANRAAGDPVLGPGPELDGSARL